MKFDVPPIVAIASAIDHPQVAFGFSFIGCCHGLVVSDGRSRCAEVDDIGLCSSKDESQSCVCALVGRTFDTEHYAAF